MKLFIPMEDRSTSPSVRRKAGFSLTELLVVLAILGLLAALILPALARAKALERLTYCKANLRQLSLAMEMYVADHGCYPFYLMVLSSPSNFVTWDEALYPYTRNHWTNALYRCPTARYPARPTRYDPKSRAWITPDGSYGYNWIGTGELPATSGARVLHLGLGAMSVAPGPGSEATRKESELAAPSEMAQLGDGSGGQISPPSAVSPDYQQFAHGKSLNITFCDGHAETVPGYTFYAPTTEARSRFNFDHLPHPETWMDDPKTPPPDHSDPSGSDHSAPETREEEHE